LVAGAIGGVLIATAPQTTPEEKVRAVRIVQVVNVAPSIENISVSAQGTVVPARSVTIVPQVSGLILEHHQALVPGGFIARGEELARIDSSDYELALTEKQ